LDHIWTNILIQDPLKPFQSTQNWGAKVAKFTGHKLTQVL